MGIPFLFLFVVGCFLVKTTMEEFRAREREGEGVKLEEADFGGLEGGMIRSTSFDCQRRTMSFPGSPVVGGERERERFSSFTVVGVWTRQA